MMRKRSHPSFFLALVLLITLLSLLYSIYTTAYYRQRGTRLSIQSSSDSTQSSTTKTKTTQNDAKRKKLSAEEVGQRFENRLQLYAKGCQKYSQSTLFRRMQKYPRLDKLDAYYPQTNVSVQFCRIEKTASTTWGYLFHTIRKKMGSLGIPQTHNASHVKQITFLFVRDPYSRLVSAYVDKLFSPNTRFWGMGRYIVKTFRPNPSNHSLSCGHDVTFAEFIRYVIHSQKTGQRRDGHFVPIHDHCALCSNTSYDYIGHLETLSEDMPYMLQVMQSPLNYTTNFDSHTLADNSYWVLKRMAPEIRKCMSMKEACLRLWKKWHVRGILSNTQPLPVTAEKAEVISSKDFTTLAVQALARAGPKEGRRKQKREALEEAFASVPLKVRLELQKLLFLDFELFGFDPEPESVFPSSGVVESPEDGVYRYFDIQH